MLARPFLCHRTANDTLLAQQPANLKILAVLHKSAPSCETACQLEHPCSAAPVCPAVQQSASKAIHNTSSFWPSAADDCWGQSTTCSAAQHAELLQRAELLQHAELLSALTTNRATRPAGYTSSKVTHPATHLASAFHQNHAALEGLNSACSSTICSARTHCATNHAPTVKRESTVNFYFET
jgi:hypothetical protein